MTNELIQAKIITSLGSYITSLGIKLYTVEPRYNAVVGVLSGNRVIDEASYCEVTVESRSQYSSHSVLVQYCGKSTGSEIGYRHNHFLLDIYNNPNHFCNKMNTHLG